MAKKPQEQQDKTDDLGGLPPELQVDGNTQQSVAPTDELNDKPHVEPVSKPDPEPKSDNDDETDDIYVVVKGRSVQHNGVLYTESQQIELEDSDAERLVTLGVVMSLASVREKLVQANPTGTVTISGG
ncbi:MULTISPECIES: hypothetical protein [Providencia]|uniref:hypothetical protein n=1 Tax=Providencia TaxID=586 RepID=UPI000DE6712B|nr:hypothetical protein [Providencia sp. PROV261]GHB89988.1 hypothetical protein GCM10007290_15140 [Providencia thailandensis]SST02847.1 Uncharacterised protein [Acinetobacter baumannii]